MKKFAILLLAFALPCLGRAQLISVTAVLSGSQEVPARATTATGWGTGLLDQSTGWFVFDMRFKDLTTPQTAAHFHTPAGPGMTAPVEIPLPLGSPMHFEGIVSSLFQSRLLEGLVYVNVHTRMFPGGEIRGQLVGTPVPEPSTYGLFGAAALAGMVVYRRRKANRVVQV